MTSHRLALALLAGAAVAAACGGRTTGDTQHLLGATEFTSQAPGSGARTTGTSGPGGAAGTTATPSATDQAAASSRAIEEADVYRKVGDTLFVLNAYRGLQVVDLSDLSSPRLLAKVPVLGRPVDLYVRGTTALVLVSDAFSYRVLADGAASPRRGSRLVAIDVADPAAPRVTAELDLDGEVEESRLVGEVLYVVSRWYWWYDWAALASAGSDAVYVASVDVSAPSRPAVVDRLELPASGWDVHANVTQARVTLSFAAWALDAAGRYAPLTRFQVVDISDPDGALAAGATFSAAGTVRDRWGMDHDDATGLFRAVLDSGSNTGAALETWRSTAPGEAVQLGRLTVPVHESLTAARFDGPRVYLVTALRTDPLWVVDGSDPAAPRLAGELAMPGQLDFLEPRGDRLVALGHTNEAGQPWQLAATLVDVSDLAAPRLLARVTFGAGYGWVNASADDLRKAFLVFDPAPAGLGLLLVPLQGWDPSSWRWTGGTQLIDWSGDALALRGFLSHPGSVSRAFPAEPSGATLVALSDQALQVIDAADRGAPAERARLDLARPVNALELFGGKLAELAGDWYQGDAELVVTEPGDPDAATPLARLHLAAPQADLFKVGEVAWVLARDWSTGTGWLQAVDLADPAHPRLRGRLDLSASQIASPGGRWWGSGDEAVLVGGALALHRYSWMTCVATPCNLVDQLRILDLTDPDAPRLASTVSLPGAAWSWGLQASGSYLWLTHFEWTMAPAASSGAAAGRYYVDRVDLADPAHPVLLAKVNVPGVLFSASPDGVELLTLEDAWTGERSVSTLHRLELLADGKAHLRGSAELPGFPSGAARLGGHAYAVTNEWTYGFGALGVVSASSRSRLVAVELSGMAVTSAQEVQGSWAWLQKAAGRRLFLQAGWQDQGILLYGLADPGRPALDGFFRTQGWVQDVVVGDGVAYLPSGPYGVPMIDLAP